MKYTDPLYQTLIPFGVHSHWVQPWRGYLETLPASHFLAGIGVVLNTGNPDLICQMLVKHGISIVRMEIGWGNVNYADNLITNAKIIANLQACQKWGLRPIILLNSNHGAPCPNVGFYNTATVAAPVGATTLTLADVSKIVLGKTGISYVSEYISAQVIITAINGNVVTLSKPLPKAIAVGQRLTLTTLKFRPFSLPGTPDYLETMNGWKSYVLTVGKLCGQYVGIGKFDLEIWNELTFGSNFLYINKYYTPAYVSYDEQAIWSQLVEATVGVATANPEVFVGTEFSDGFANTIPWPASSTEPARVTAISKHPYPPLVQFPAKEQKTASLNAMLGQENPPKFVPSYQSFFPEYSATSIQTENLIRDISPLSTDIYKKMHGRNFRANNQCWGWITEIGMNSHMTDSGAAMLFKAKMATRVFCFYLNKGCKKVTIFGAGGGDLGLGILLDSFIAYCQTNTVYPADDTSYISPALLGIKNISYRMRGSGSNGEVIRQLKVAEVTDTHDHAQFQGDGTPEHPNLFDREVLAILPFQVSPNHFVIPYYVMTRNLAVPLNPESFTITLQGVRAATARVMCYDPLNDSNYPIGMDILANDTISVLLDAADYPYLLMIED
jgi:hypothetical protein